MRTCPFILSSLLITACSSGPTTKEDGAMAVDTVALEPVEWPGYYEDTLPCADCPGLYTQLWVRSDSTFVLRQRYLERDSLAFGTIGQWHVVAPQGPEAHRLMTIGYAGDKPDFYQHTTEGLLLVDEMGTAASSGLDHSLDKLADETGDAIPRMRIKGTFTYLADAQSFQPCGMMFSWPCVGGMDLGEEEGEPVVQFNNADLQKAYMQAVKNGGDPWTVEVICTLGMGPAAEGDGADEFIFIEQPPRPLERCP